jgi:GH15 family glucan-1,4-alpha-glucosidase
MVLETTWRGPGGTAKVTDLFAMREGGKSDPRRQIIRIVEGVEGSVEMTLEIEARFDYGEIHPWIRAEGDGLYSLMGGDEALVLWTDLSIERRGDHGLACRFTVAAGETCHVSIAFALPHVLADRPPDPSTADELEDRLQETLQWWERWAAKADVDDDYGDAEMRSALVLKSLTFAPTGAIVAAPTTSLPEQPGGSLNWDYRYSWVRDSSFSVRSLAELGYEAEADGFRRFVERSSAGHADDLQIMYGIQGERRLNEYELDELEGYRRARPVRIGNKASRQTQLDVYGEILQLAWRWWRRGHTPDEDYWTFLTTLVDMAADRWSRPDAGIWESRGDPQHYVLSKAMCWSTVDRGIDLAEGCGLEAPLDRWKRARDDIRTSIETNGVDPRRDVYVRSYWRTELDAALLLLPRIGYVGFDDDRMVRTTDAIREELGADGRGLLYRYKREPGQEEGAFVCCSFWLVECLAHQGRKQEAREVFEHTVGTANDLGLFPEEFDVAGKDRLGNYPLALSHLSHIAAAVALAEADRDR